eukprot:gene7078-14398_t
MTEKYRKFCWPGIFIPFLILIFTITLFTFVSNNSTIRESLRSRTLSKNDKFAASSLMAPKNYAANKGLILGLDSENDIKIVNKKYFPSMIESAMKHPRKRKMSDLTKDPQHNSMQILVNTWTNGSYSPVHFHSEYSETFVILEGALAFFTFTKDNFQPICTILTPTTIPSIIIEKGEYHAMTTAPMYNGYPGYAIIYEISGHTFDPKISSKTLAPFAPSVNNGLDGDPVYFQEKLLPLCK